MCHWKKWQVVLYKMKKVQVTSKSIVVGIAILYGIMIPKSIVRPAMLISSKIGIVILQ